MVVRGPGHYSPLHQAHARIEKEDAASRVGRALTEPRIPEKNYVRYSASVRVPGPGPDRAETRDQATAIRSAGQGESRAQYEWRRLESARVACEAGVAPSNHIR